MHEGPCVKTNSLSSYFGRDLYLDYFMGTTSYSLFYFPIFILIYLMLKGLILEKIRLGEELLKILILLPLLQQGISIRLEQH